MNFNVLWEKHKKYIQFVMAMGVLFLGLLSYSLSDLQTQHAKAEKIESKINKVEDSYSNLGLRPQREQDKELVLKKRLDHFLARVSLIQNTKVTIPDELNNASTDFLKAYERVWTSFADQARRKNVKHPTRGDLDFGLGSKLSNEEWVDRYHQLEVIRRVLNAAVKLGVKQIHSIQPKAITSEAIQDLKDFAVINYPVEASFSADYKTYRALVENFQADHEFLSCQMQLERTKEKDGLIRASITFSGIDIAKPRVEKTGGRKSGRGGFNRGRGRR